MRAISKQLLNAIVVVLFAGAARAALPPAQKTEIDHLLNFVRQTTCEIERNGSLHDGAAAADHIEKKFAYYRDRIDSTEKFIELSASRSTVSGRYYTVRCGDGERIRTRDWLLKELGDFRRNGNP